MGGVSLGLGDRVPGPLEMVRATAADLPRVLALLTEAAQWARERGVENLWRVPFPVEWIEPSLVRGEVYLALRDGALVGTATFRWSDPLVWGERPPEAGYLHRLTSRRGSDGKGVGRAMVEWAAHRVKREGRRFLRLDCRSTNAGLRRYYRSLGFAPVGNHTIGDPPFEIVLWERAIR